MLRQLKEEEKELTNQLIEVKNAIEKETLKQRKIKFKSLVGKYFKKLAGYEAGGDGVFYQILKYYPAEDCLLVNMLHNNTDKENEFIFYKGSIIDSKWMENLQETTETEYNYQVQLFINYE